MSPLDERRLRVVSDAILRYFEAHPDAADSVTDEPVALVSTK